MNWKKKITISAISVFTILFLLFYMYVYPNFSTISGYTAKNMCSCVFIGDIDEHIAKSEDINFNIMSLATTEVDYTNQTVTASVFGLKTTTAYYSKNTGCALLNKLSSKDRYTFKNDWNITKYDSLENWFAYIDTIEYLNNGQTHKLEKAINAAFIEVAPLQRKKNTRAVAVLYKGQLVGEQYAPHFNKDSKLLGWSMTKSLTASIFALLEDEGKVTLNDQTQIAAWQNDDRKKITWNQLLHMNSGLKWKEEYLGVTDAVKMFFMSDGAGEFATSLPMIKQPNTQWEYSSGTTNIIAKQMRTFFSTNEAYVRYIYDHLFYKIGMYSMLLETDALGVFVGSSYSWATTRDWAKFGQLYLQDGNWAGEQLLPKKWVDFVQEPAPNSDNRYGGHFWLNKGGNLPDVPKDMYALNGFQGQRVFIIPSKDLVVVRLGLTPDRKDFDFNQWLSAIITAVE